MIELAVKKAPDLTGIPLNEAGQVVLGAGGLVSQMLPGYEPRDAQVAMADLVGEVLAQANDGESCKTALIEAGTGTGKSLAYLIPSILCALQQGQKIVISTDTIQLQEQLIGKDLPFLEKALGRPILFAIAKGKSNWFCQRNCESNIREIGPVNPGVTLLLETALREFTTGKWDGDKSHLTLPVADSVWPDLSADDTCEGKSCKLARTCPLMQSKERLENADIIITNHTMYLLHWFVWSRCQKGILPEHSIWIADEAHTLPDKAQDVFGTEISEYKIPSVVSRVLKQSHPLNISLDNIDVDGIRRANARYFKNWHGAMKDQMLVADFPEPIRNAAHAAMLDLVETLKPLRVSLNLAAADVPAFDVERKYAVAALADSVELLISSLKSIHADPGENDVIYCEVEPKRNGTYGEKVASLHRKPAESAAIFRGAILANLNAAIFTSATLSSGNGGAGFRMIKDELGLPIDAQMMQVQSPFDYARQVTGYISQVVPRSQDPCYHTTLANELLHILTETQGRAFVLFTSIRDMRKAYELVVSRCRFPILLQGTAPKDALVTEFKETPNAVLFGVRTFWTGVDIPGDSLSCVVIVKLPFPSPEHPLAKAKCDRIKARGGNDFVEYSLPRCMRDFLQGFGRLIRTKTDRGLFVCLDERIRTTRYGTQIRNSLPTFPWVTQLKGWS